MAEDAGAVTLPLARAKISNVGRGLSESETLAERAARGDARRDALADTELRADVERFLRGRVPRNEVDDLLQTTLADALAAADGPEDAEEVRRWVFGIARHKVADHYRRGGREVVPDSDASPLDAAAAESGPQSARDLLRWAQRELPDTRGAEDTLEWMLREGHGEKLEHIARDEDVPAPRVRQRVVRMRKYFRERWAQQLAAAGIVALLLVGVWIWRERASEPAPIAIPETQPDELKKLERASELRRAALEDCAAERWQECIAGLDRASALDPVGDRAAAVRDARAAAQRALTPQFDDAPKEQPDPDVPNDEKGDSPGPKPTERKGTTQEELGPDSNNPAPTSSSSPPKLAPPVQPKNVAPPVKGGLPKKRPLPKDDPFESDFLQKK